MTGPSSAEGPDDEDPALGPFLDLLAADLVTRPAEVGPLGAALEARLKSLTERPAEDDLAAPIEGDVTL
jgi:hypothetical protein